MMELQLFLTYILVLCLFLMSCLSESFLSEIPEKVPESFLSEVFLPKVFLPKVFDFNIDEEHIYDSVMSLLSHILQIQHTIL